MFYEQFNRINLHFIGFLNTKKGKKERCEYVIIKSELILVNLRLLFVTLVNGREENTHEVNSMKAN